MSMKTPVTPPTVVVTGRQVSPQAVLPSLPAAEKYVDPRAATSSAARASTPSLKKGELV
jgi:hypothetical protein